MLKFGDLRITDLELVSLYSCYIIFGNERMVWFSYITLSVCCVLSLIYLFIYIKRIIFYFEIFYL